ncbi:MAG: arginine--tRNA ligase [Armatimonadetes bacterium]|nr:arginine--tRNA ligase [Armatimonadota bacterium]
MRGALQSLLENAVQNLVREGCLPPEGLPAIEVADPKDPSHGDFACNFALAASKVAGKPPREIAERLVACLAPSDLSDKSDQSDGHSSAPLISSAEIAGPGFINLRLNPSAVAAHVPRVLELGVEGFKNSASPIAHRASRIASSPENLNTQHPAPLRLNVEFVSVNPNGPITVGSGRGAAFGSTLCNVLEAAGHPVHREYYINDGVNSEQMRLFTKSVQHYYEVVDKERNPKGWTHPQKPDQYFSFPENGYLGEHVLDAARDLHDAWDGVDCFDDFNEQPLSVWQSRVQAIMLSRQRQDLSSFSTTFDTWFSEQSLHDSGTVAGCLEELDAKGAADVEPYQLEILKKKGEPDQIVRHDQPVEEEEEPGTEGQGDEGTTDDDLSDLSDKSNESELTARVAPSQGGGATLWLRSTKFGDQKDRVLRRKDGRLTYIASDVAYHKDKFRRGSKPDAEGHVQPADKLLTILGPDHHGYIGRLQAVVGALLEEGEGERREARSEESEGSGEGRGAKGEVESNMSDSADLSDFERELYKSPAERDACQAALEEAKKRLEVVIFQIVRFVKDGKPAPMRKRDGNIYSLRDLMAEIGKNAAPNAPEAEQMRIGCDVARFFYLMRSHDTHMDFDLDLAEKQSDENPVYYVQYAHARICSVIAKAAESGLRVVGLSGVQAGEPSNPGSEHRAPENRTPENPNTSLLTHPKELALIKKILDLPFEVRRCAEDYGVHRLTTYAMDLARAYHGFYDACRVIQPEEPELSQARLALCEAARTGLRAVFELLGISAPERMERAEPAA